MSCGSAQQVGSWEVIRMWARVATKHLSVGENRTSHELWLLFSRGRQTAPYSPEPRTGHRPDRTETAAPHASGVGETLHTLW